MNPSNEHIDYKLTDLDYLTGDHHLQMMKAALPFLNVPQQRALSMFVKLQELKNTFQLLKMGNPGNGHLFPGFSSWEAGFSQGTFKSPKTLWKSGGTKSYRRGKFITGRPDSLRTDPSFSDPQPAGSF